MDAKELQQLKAGIQKARKSQVNFAYSPNKNPKEDDALMIHPRKKPKMLLVAVKKQTQNPKSMCGYVTIKSKEMTIECIGKPPTQGLIKMMRKFLISQKLNFKIHVKDEDGNTVHNDYAEEEGAETPDHLLDTFSHETDEVEDAGSDEAFTDDELAASGENLEDTEEDEDTSAEDAAAAAAEDAAQEEILRDKLTAILAALRHKVERALGVDEEYDNNLKQQLAAVEASVKALDDPGTQAGVKAVLALLAQAPKAPKVDQQEVFAAIKAFTVQRANVEAELGSLMAKLRAHDDPRMKLIEAKGPSQALTGAASVLQGNLDSVIGNLKEWGAADAKQKDAIAKKLSASIATLNNHMNSDKLIDLLEKNPLGVSVSIKKPIEAALKDIEQKMSV
ncbi:hypothetical protein SAMN05444141_101365 [Pseudovibrio denitrificans]|uniref:Uncharacterized protein n=1 Tax=Pseudovibrio denitrificans TaxID=258256 RepID=A0A1I6XQR3_9HYPH|nr:hypothetical protein [Pseudovibrio denitrificans]SFT40506.1 hypothetical protein SAMN05444141_101365 [Pseudovibrio denitrificans]